MKNAMLAVLCAALVLSAASCRSAPKAGPQDGAVWVTNSVNVWPGEGGVVVHERRNAPAAAYPPDCPSVNMSSFDDEPMPLQPAISPPCCKPGDPNCGVPAAFSGGPRVMTSGLASISGKQAGIGLLILLITIGAFLQWGVKYRTFFTIGASMFALAFLAGCSTSPAEFLRDAIDAPSMEALSSVANGGISLVEALLGGGGIATVLATAVTRLLRGPGDKKGKLALKAKKVIAADEPTPA